MFCLLTAPTMPHMGVRSVKGFEVPDRRQINGKYYCED